MKVNRLKVQPSTFNLLTLAKRPRNRVQPSTQINLQHSTFNGDLPSTEIYLQRRTVELLTW
ncbi:MAG: hypothetical protein F6K26_09000 [Moorea sp. SIO2I5]|nr:hypothetical protein [Moorena sp. SIO2I5]